MASISQAPLTPYEVLERLGVRVGAPWKCSGFNKGGLECGTSPGKDNSGRAITAARKLGMNWGKSRANGELLEELSRLVMCRHHGDQAASELNRWTTNLIGNEASNAWARHSSSHELATNISSSRLPGHQVASRSNNPQSSAINQQALSPESILACTRSYTNQVARSAHSKANHPQFEPFAKKKSPFQVNLYTLEKIMQSISKEEIWEGFVYGFRRRGCSLIKIGMTRTTVDQRLRNIGRKCNYEPILVFVVRTKHAMKVEHLVHRYFYQQNRRECLLNGGCNGGRGCSSRHIEWFENLSDAEAETVVQAFADWMETEPYDENGCLKMAWRLKAKCLDLSSRENIWMRWISIRLGNDVNTERHTDALHTAIKVEKVVVALSELRPLKSRLSISTIKIKREIWICDHLP